MSYTNESHVNYSQTYARIFIQPIYCNGFASIPTNDEHKFDTENNDFYMQLKYI